MRAVAVRFATMLLLGLPSLAAAQSLEPTDLADFDWKLGASEYRVGAGNAAFQLGSDEAIALGAEAGRVMRFIQGTSGYDDVQALIYKINGSMSDSFVTVEHYDIGYIRDHDWDNVDSDALLARFMQRGWRV